MLSIGSSKWTALLLILGNREDRYHGSKKAGELAQKEKSFLESLGKIGSLGKRKGSKFLENNFVQMVAAHRNMTDDNSVNKVEETVGSR